MSVAAGTIINVSSTAGYVAMGSYSAIKTWVTAYTESLANELHGTGVKVTALCPGWVRTEFHERANINIGSIPSRPVVGRRSAGCRLPGGCRRPAR